MKLFSRYVVIAWIGVMGVFFSFVNQSFAQYQCIPELNKEFPDKRWINYDGQKFDFANLKGSVVLVEFIGMNCPACQAFSGAHQKGGYQGITPQGDLMSMEEYFPQYSGGISLADERIFFVQILLYSMSMGPPDVNDAKMWAEHFGLDHRKNTYIIVSSESLIGSVSYNLIPGFALLDKKGVMRSLSAGHNPTQNLYTDFLPMVPKLLTE